MLNNFKDLAVKHVKTIVDSNRCGLCDRNDGDRMRFACGHWACVGCVAVTEDCPTCSPLMDSNSRRPQADAPLTERVKLATDLFTTFQDTFHIDVYQRQRISDRLKVEKELFPECIQAPSKYFNKRKSLNLSSNNKENSFTFFPGEGISSKQELTMNKPRSYVQDWLNKQTSPNRAPSRSPFSDLHINTHHNSPAPKNSTTKGKEKSNIIKQSTRQSNRKISILKQSPSCLENYMKPVEKSQSKTTWMSTKRLKKAFSENTKPRTDKGHFNADKKHCDESGIVIDDDCFTIEDTQNQVVDKDRLAFLAVAKADSACSSTAVVDDPQALHDVNSEKDSTTISCKDQQNVISKVPFYRKSFLFENCGQCWSNDDGPGNLTNSQLHEESSKKYTDISITVENKSFITTITVVDCPRVDKKQSISVQTELEEPFLGFEQTTEKDEAVQIISNIKEYIQSEIKFTEGNKSDTDSQVTRCTDAILNKNSAETNFRKGDMVVDHQNEYGVLTEIGAGTWTRKRKVARGVTPDSTNSSDKENCDPNRMKKRDGKKKKKLFK